MTVEAKNYRLWRQLKGEATAIRQVVPLTPFIQNQIHKDVLWRRAGKGQQRVIQWDFVGAPPSTELRTLLTRWEINIIEDVP